MKFKHGLGIAVVLAALAAFAVSATGVFATAPEAETTTELHYCEGQLGTAGYCATVVVPDSQWPEADGAINACLESTPVWTATDVEKCIAKWDPTAVSVRSHISDGGPLSRGNSDAGAHVHSN